MGVRELEGSKVGGGRKGRREVGDVGGSRDAEGWREGWGVKKEGERKGGTKRGKEGRREGTRTKPGNQLVYYICIHLLDPHWTMPRQAVICT